MMIRQYSELIRIPTFEERFEYLSLKGVVGESTFGFDRAFNQMFYNSTEWKRVRRDVILRDNCCDLAMIDHEITGGTLVLIHHINPISIEDIKEKTKMLLDPEYLITTIMRTHNAIHYGDKNLLEQPLIERSRNDTCPWRR